MEDEISLRELIETIWNGKVIIAVITLVCLLAGMIYGYVILDPVYEARTILSVNQAAKQTNKSSGLEGLVEEITELPQANAASYAAQVKTASVLRSTMESIGVDPKAMSVSAFASKIKVTNIKDTDLLEITVKDKDSLEAANMANALAEVFVEFISATSRNRVDQSIAFLENQLKEEQKKVDASIEKMQNFLKQSPGVTQLEKELEANLLILATLRASLVDYEIRVNGLRASIEAGEKELAGLSDKIELKKSLFDDPVLYHSTADNDGVNVTSAGEMELLTEEINPAFVSLVQQINIDRQALALAEGQKTSAGALLNTIVEQIASIQLNLAEKKTRQNQLEADLNIAVQNYDIFNKKYTDIKAAQSVRAGEAAIHIVSEAHAPVVPVGPGKKMYLAVSVILGLMLGFLTVFIRYTWYQSRNSKNSRQESERVL